MQTPTADLIEQARRATPPEQLSRPGPELETDRYPLTGRQRALLIEELRHVQLNVTWAIKNLQSGAELDKCTESADVRYLMRSLHTDITHR